MCGIYGAFSYKGNAKVGVLEPMAEAVKHRGPDGVGSFCQGPVAMGNKRLAILGLLDGDQPFVSNDGQISVIQNGEIYNYLELQKELKGTEFECHTHSDTEVLLNLYLRDGINFIDRLNGMFGIAIYDARIQTLHLIRDRVGVKPLFIAERGDELLFCSEIKGILAAGFPRRFSAEALHHMLTFNYVPPPLTIFEGVRHLPPGCRAEITTSGCTVKRWWDLTRMSSDQGTEDQYREEFLALLEDSVRLRMRSDVPFGAFLSGGLDSSSVVALMTRHCNEPVKTFAIGFDDPRFDETAFAAQIAERYKTEHKVEKVKPDLVSRWPHTLYHCDQPHGDVSFLPYLWVSELAVNQVKVVLTGDGGDELFGGYEKYTKFFAQEDALTTTPDDFATRYHSHISVLNEKQKDELYTCETRHAIGGQDSFAITQNHLKDVNHWDRINQALYLDIALLLPGNNLVKPDRMPMAVSLEARDPFLDPRLIELSARMPGTFKIRGETTRYLYKKAVEPLLGHELTYRKKQMFTVPIGEWFKKELKPFVAETLLGDRATSRGIFNPETVRRYVDEHCSGGPDRTREIRCLLAVEIWCRIFLDQTDLPPTFTESSRSEALGAGVGF